MSTTVRYKGNTLATAENQTKVLKTAGKYMEDDVTIVDVSSGPSPTLITKSITANGTYNASSDNADGYSSVTVEVSGGGGGGGSASKKQINFIDYDGTILYSYTKAEIDAMSSLPANPSHTGLVAQGWNWTLAQIKAQLTDMPDGDVWVGQMYITESGKTEIDVNFPDSARLSPIMTIAVNGTVMVDWGDNTTPDTVTGSSLETMLEVSHTYSNAGDYTISITSVSGAFCFYGSTVNTLLRKGTVLNENRVYANCVQAVRLGSGVTSIGAYAFYDCHSLASIAIPSSVTSIGNYAFQTCSSLASVTIPSGVTSIGIYAFQTCYSLASVTIPSGVTSIGNYAFQTCYSLASITIPSSVTSIGTYAINNCHSLASIAIPSSVTSIGNYAFQADFSLASVTIPSGVTSIGNNMFNNCSGVAEYHLLRVTPPILSNTNAFNNIPSDCIIYVPSESLEAYQAATNWSTYARKMVGE